MKAAAVVIAVVAWGGFLGALWYALVAPVRPPVGLLLAVVAGSFLVGLIVPAYLLGLEGRLPGGPDKRRAMTGSRSPRSGQDERA